MCTAALQGASDKCCTVMKHYILMNIHKLFLVLLYNLHTVSQLGKWAHVAAGMQQTLEQLVNTFLETPRAFSPALVLAPACSLLAEQGFKLSGMHGEAFTLLHCVGREYHQDVSRPDTLQQQVQSPE